MAIAVLKRLTGLDEMVESAGKICIGEDKYLTLSF